jgi:bla regulator protein blaR1
LIAGIAEGKPNYDAMSPELAEAVRQQLGKLQSDHAKFGSLVSVEFVGVGNQGWDIYSVKYEHGTSLVRIALDSNGIIVGALESSGP